MHQLKGGKRNRAGSRTAGRFGSWKRSLGALIVGSALLAGTSAQCQALGQRPPAEPLPARPGAISINDVCAAAPPLESQGNQFSWSPGSRSLAYFRPLPTGFGLRLELDIVDADGSHRSVLLSQQQIDQLFPAVAKGDKIEYLPPPRRSVGFEWAPDGSGLLLHSDTSLVWLDRRSLQTRSLLSGDDAIADVQLAPDGQFVAFVRGHNLWTISIAGGAARAITRGGTDSLRKGELDWMYPASLGARHGYAWAPDSSRIAYFEFDLRSVTTYTPPFTQGEPNPVGSVDYPLPGAKNPVVRVLVAGLAAKAANAAPLVIDTGKETDVYLPRLQWLPDGKRLAIERLDRPQSQLDLLIADAATGSSRIALTEKDAYWIDLNDDLHFLKSAPQFLWSSQRSGYRHLYLYGLDGKLVRQLTDGKWEVTSIDAVNEATGTVYYTATEKSSLERQLYSASLNAPPATDPEANRITRESGTHEATFSPLGSAFVDNFSTATKPWVQTAYRLDPRADPPKAAIKLFALQDPPAPRPVLHQVEFLTVKTHDGVDLNALMIRPAGFVPDKKYPAVVYVRGGPGQQAVHDQWDGDISMYQQLLAQHGYLVYAVDNRGTGGRGHLFEEYVHLRFEAQEMTDLKDAVRFLDTLPYVDPARIGIWGRGFGGALTVNAMLHGPALFKAGFAVAPIVNWLQQDSAFAERYLGDRVKNQDGYLSSSPLDDARGLKGSLLVVHGTDDLDVHPDQSMLLEHALLGARKYAEVLLFPGQTHAIDDPAACAVLYQRATDLFGKAL